MNATASRKAKQAESWPQEIKYGEAKVTVYKRATPSGFDNFMVADYSSGKRRFLSFKTKAEAMDRADALARQMAGLSAQVRSITNDEAIDYFNSVERLRPYRVTVDEATAKIAECLQILGGFENLKAVKEAVAQCKPLPSLAELSAAAKFFKSKHRTFTPKRVADVVAELLALKKARGAAARYLDDLQFRLEKFAEKFPCNIGSVTTADVQAWLDGLKLSSQSYANNRRCVHLLFEHGVARGYCLDNPAADVERPKIRNGEVKIFTPDETRKLLAAAPEDFLPCLALGLFAGLRSAEIERLEWKDIDLKQGHVVVGADAAKTASRRIVPIAENLAVWLAPYAGRTGGLWPHGRDYFHKRQEATAKAAGVAWKANGCRHSFASYSFALCADAGRVAGYCGNSPGVIHRHYKQLCTPADAQKFFSIKPAIAVNVLPATAIANT